MSEYLLCSRYHSRCLGDIVKKQTISSALRHLTLGGARGGWGVRTGVIKTKIKRIKWEKLKAMKEIETVVI